MGKYCSHNRSLEVCYGGSRHKKLFLGAKGNLLVQNRLNSKIRKWNQKTASPWNLCKHLVIKEAEHQVENRACTGHFRLVVAKIVSRDSGIESKNFTCKRNTISEEYTTIMFTNGNSIGSRTKTTQELARFLVVILDLRCLFLAPSECKGSGACESCDEEVLLLAIVARRSDRCPIIGWCTIFVRYNSYYLSTIILYK